VVEVQDPIMPVQVKTVKAKLAQTAELGPAIVQVPEESTVAARLFPSSKTAPPAKSAFVTPAAGTPAAVAEPGPDAAPPPKATVYAFKPTAVSATSRSVERPATETATRDAKRFAGGQNAATHAGWIVQIGAFDIEREAQQRLSNARAKVGHVLDHAQSFTEAVSKGEKRLEALSGPLSRLSAEGRRRSSLQAAKAKRL
jgi:D-alanyl-D-alanine carboxypeptidase